MSTLLFFLLVCFLAWAGTRLYTKMAVALNIFDVPNYRSSHGEPKPRGAGIVLVLLFLIIIFLLMRANIVSFDLGAALLGSGFVAATIGYLADQGKVSIIARLTVQSIAAIWAIYWLGGVAPLELGSGFFQWKWAGQIVVLIGLVWLVNLCNFMDGLDGLAASEAVFVALSASLLVPEMDWIALLFGAVFLGFLPSNWSPAKVFMGDVGSCFVGMIFGVLGMFSSAGDFFSPWVWVILLGVFVVDATFTLVRRILGGQAWHQAHRHHAYQHAAIILQSHRSVVLVVLVINVCWLLPLAWLATHFGSWGAALVFIAYMPLVALAYFLRAGAMLELKSSDESGKASSISGNN